MHARKNRVPFQGITNFAVTSSQLKCSLGKPISSTHSVSRLTHISTSNADSLGKEEQMIKRMLERRLSESQLLKTPKIAPKITRKSQTMEQSGCQQDCGPCGNGSLARIRKSYKGKFHVWRIARSWNFPDRGYITGADLKAKMEESVGIRIDQKQLEGIVQKYGDKEGKLDIQNFLKIIYGQVEYSSYMPKLFNIGEPHQYRSSKIDFLAEKITNEEKAGNLKVADQHCQQGLLSPSMKLSQKSQIFNKEGGSVDFAKTQFLRVNQSSFEKLKHSVMPNDLHPQKMLNINQAKTRFGATPYCQVPAAQKVERFDKNNFSQAEKEHKQRRNEIRGQILRQISQKQEQSIRRTQQTHNERESASLLRRRLDREAYEYTCFMKNSWL